MSRNSEIIYPQAAVFPIRKCGENVQILLINNRSNNRLIIPKGIIENGITARQTAETEASIFSAIDSCVSPADLYAVRIRSPISFMFNPELLLSEFIIVAVYLKDSKDKLLKKY